MSKYVISDIHGCYDKFIKMLKLINFNADDELFIIGDIFDRGEKPLEILDFIRAHENINLIKGNHEHMYIEYYENKDTKRWYRNGGEITHNEINKRGNVYEENIYKYLKSLPFLKVIDKFILVHAGLIFKDDYESLEIDDFINQDEHTCIWDRSNIENDLKFKDYTIISGHTPVQSITKSSDDVKIIKRKGTIYIDCGCVYPEENGKLACLCLDSMEEYYIK